ncbi:DUF72 domain-containing protein [bacterium]|nr:DUF72 domain-containing protein [candidate division CSSED10-310 bacterium]
MEANKPRSVINVGTSGYSYPDWKGPFYPDSLPKTEYLEYYSRYFNILELNFSFYRLPDVKQVSRLLDRMKKQFTYCVKAHQSFTHGEGTKDDLKKNFSLVRPMHESGVLGAMLFQFPFRFKNTEKNWEKLRIISDEKKEIPAVIEFRDQSWIIPATFVGLRQLGLGFCCLDGPNLPDLPGRVSALTSPIGYVRFHGRNAEKWWNHTHAWERYSYLYSAGQLYRWVPILKSYAKQATQIYVFFNNHYQGQAVRNAQLLMAFLSE